MAMQPSQPQTPGVAPMTPPNPAFGAGTAQSRPSVQPGQSGALPQTQPAPMPQQPSVTPLGYGQQAAIQPGHDLRNQTIAPGQESNRFGLAKQYLDTYSQQQLPQFQSQLRSAIQGRAALGGLGSGMLNTDVGNLDLAQQRDYNAHAQNFLTDALGNQINDNANQRQELRGERGYENGLEDQGYNRARQGMYDQDYLTNSSFNRGLEQAQFGYGGNPAGAQAAAGDYYGQQSANAGNALSGMIQNSQLLKALGMGGLNQSSPAPQSGITPEVLQSLGGIIP